MQSAPPFAWGTAWTVRRPSSSTITSSPGRISRSSSAPTRSSAHVSDATTQSSPSCPTHSGRNPCASRKARSFPSESATTEKAPSSFAIAATMASPSGAGLHERLGVPPLRGAGGRVARVADRDLAVEAAQLLLVEDLGDEAHVAQRGQATVVGDGDPRRLLAAVLEGEEAEVGDAGDVPLGRVDAEEAAHQRWLFPFTYRMCGSRAPSDART